MKNVGIITLSGNFNYENRLQNYALQESLKKMGCSVVTYWNTIGHEIPKKQKVKNGIKNNLLFVPKYYHEHRRKNFEKFTKNYIKHAPYVITSENVNKDKFKKLDYVVLGSDQIWNYTFEDFSKVSFAHFEDKSKNISYAASFGIQEIAEDKKEFYKEGLNNVGKISVREDSGVELVKDLSGKDATVVLDPTLLLSKWDYIKIEKKPKHMTKKPYLLTYFLGDLSVERQKEIKKYAKRKNLEIINLNKMNQMDYYIAGPREFLYLFHHASIIFTDSFHACTFSFLYHKPFYVFDRIDPWMKNMNSRLDTFLGKFKLEDHKIDSLKKVKHSMRVDYEKAYMILEEERKNSLNFLLEALELKEEIC